MKPRTFAVGDRVKLRGYAVRGMDVEDCTGEIKRLNAGTGNLIEVRLDPKHHYDCDDEKPWVYPSQIKSRLIKKAKPEPREWDLAMPTMDSIWRPIVMGVGTASVGGEVRTADGDGRWTIAEVIRVREVIKHRGQHGEK